MTGILDQISGNNTVLAALVSSSITIFGVFLTATLSIAGIVLNNFLQSQRLEREQKHDREQRELERVRAANKEIYIESATAMMQHLNAVQSFSNLSVPIASIFQTVLEATPVVAKANLICSEPTAAASAALAQELATATMKLALLRIQADIAKSDFDNALALHRENLDEQKSITSAFSNLPPEVRMTSESTTNFRLQSEAARDRVVEADREMTSTLATFQQRNFELVLSMQEATANLRMLFRPVIKAVRKDIGYPATEGTLNAMFAPVTFMSRDEIAKAMGIEA